MNTIQYILIAGVTVVAAFSLQAQSGERAQAQTKGQSFQSVTCDNSGAQLRDGSGQGQRKGERQLNGQRKGPQDGSGKRHGGGLRDGSGPCSENGTCPVKK